MPGDDAEQTFRALVKRLNALPETSMRREVLAEWLHDMAPENILEFFSVVVQGAARRQVDHLLALEAVHEVILLGQQQGALYERLADVYLLARETDNEPVARMLMIASPSRGPVRPQDVPGDRELSRLTLGERKYLARGHDRIRLDRLLFDPDPAVVTNLLRNPHLTERDVIRLAARRPTQGDIQKRIHESRWGDRYRVRFALVCNPYTPTDLSVKLVGFMLKKELVLLARDGNLHDLVKDEARRLLKERGRERKQKRAANDGSSSGNEDEDR